ncbi:unnamed protein product [Hyaloperonospora brassicae]|uniref:Uncharacterized protein n=1 Tax=Hyaloperonospora brassicae TaxID=162125 RepID=A0AAV0V1S2_HYABA|nr:unnamed protein product [Hyaloperonospora brassicae]
MAAFARTQRGKIPAAEERCVAGIRMLISDLSEASSECELQLKLLGALLAWAAQKAVEKIDVMIDVQLQCLQLVSARLGDGRDVRRWLHLGDQVLAALRHNAALLVKQDSQDTGNEARVDCGESRRYMVKIASILMQLREKVATADNTLRDLKIETFVWKNVVKLAALVGPLMTSVAKVGDDAGDENGVKTYSADDMLATVVVSLEWSAGQLVRDSNPTTNGMLDIGVMRFLKLYWRVFQRLVVAFAGSVEHELETCVLAIVNVTACLLYAAHDTSIPEVSGFQQELRAMMDQALDISVKLAGNATHCQIRKEMRALLWHPAEEMVRAVRQRQQLDKVKKGIESAIRWSHLLLLTAYAGLSRDVVMDSTGDALQSDDFYRAAEVAQLFARYRDCELTDPKVHSIELSELFTDVLLGHLQSFHSTAELQLTLLKQTLYPDWVQQTLCWNIWRELLCYYWNEALGAQALQVLFDVAQWDDDSSDGSFVLANGVGDEVLRLIAFVYADLPTSLQDVCLDQVTAFIDIISSEGPGHQFDMKVVSQAHLLEQLVGVRFLAVYNGPLKDEWVAKYLPICFQSCSTVLDLLSSEAKVLPDKRGSVLGMLRVLDMCLLVLRSVLDDNKLQDGDFAEFSVVLVRISTDALSQLAVQGKHATVLHVMGKRLQPLSKRLSRTVALEEAGLRCIGRATETSLYILTSLGSVLKSNSKNQCVQTIKDLLTIVANAQDLGHKGFVGIMVHTALFVNAALFDMQIACRDMAVVWRLLLALFKQIFDGIHIVSRHGTRAPLLLSLSLGALYRLFAHSNIVEMPGVTLRSIVSGEVESFRQSALMRKLSPEEVAKTLESAQSRMLQSLWQSRSTSYRVFRNRFPDEPAELYADIQQSSNDVSVTPAKRFAGDSGTVPKKYHKINHLRSLCREMESSLSSMTDNETATDILSDGELENATTALHKILAKTVTLSS